MNHPLTAIHPRQAGHRPASVLLADDSAVYRGGLARAVVAHPGLELIAEAEHGEGAVAAIIELQPDVALLDLRMPGLDGIAVCERLQERSTQPNTRCILLSAHLEPEVAQRALAAGAFSCINKASTRQQICAEAIRASKAR